VLYRSHAVDLIRSTIGCRVQNANGPGNASGATGARLSGRILPCTGNQQADFPGPDDYVVIHMLRWKDPASGSNAQSVDKQNWYVYHSDGKIDWDDDAFAKNNRIFGSKRIYLLYVHFNRADNSTYLARYAMTAKKKTPAYLLHFASLLQVFGVAQGAGAVNANAIPGAVPKAFWNATALDTYYVPSDLTFVPTMLPHPNPTSSQTTNDEASQVAAPASAAAPTAPANASDPGPEGQTTSPTGTPANPTTLPPQSLTVPGGNNAPANQAPSNQAPATAASSGIPAEVTLSSQTLDNEGLYHVDFTVAVPIRKISEISYVSSSNTLIPTKVDKQTTFGLIDYYFKAIDIKGSGWSVYPHALAGVAVDSHPLKRVLIGGGYGPLLAHFYMGLVLDTQSLPSGAACGSTPTSQQLASGNLKNRVCPGISLGLNVSVGSVLSSLKPKSTSGSGTTAK
jgi:hypothetical protein